MCWALCALTASPGARAFYDQHRAAGDTHHQALRPWATASSASCTAAYAITPTTANTPPGHTAMSLRRDRGSAVGLI